MGIEEVGSNTLPNVYISNIDVVEDQNNVSLKVKLSVKDILDDNGDGLWKNTMLENYAKIDLLCIVADNKFSGSETRQHRDDLIEKINTGSIASINVDSGFRILRKTMTLASDMMPESHVDRFGTVIHDYYYQSETIEFTKDYVNDVVLYACVYIDYSDINVGGYDFSFLKNYIGYTKSEVVYRSGRINTSTSYFIDNNTGNIWPGPVHFHEGTGWMVGAAHSDQPHARLEKVDIANPKITFNQRPPEIVVGPDTPETIDSISEPDYYFAEDDTVGAYVAMDIRNLLYNETFEGSLVYDVAPQVFDKLVNFVDISQVEIVRDRVSQQTILNPLYSIADPDLIVYDDNDKIVAITRNNFGEALQPAQRYLLDNKIAVSVDINKLPDTKDDLSILDLNNLAKDQLAEATRTGTIHEVEGTQLNGVRMINFTDEHIANLKGGEYKHTIRLTCTNKIPDVMIQRFRDLKTSIEQNRKTLLDSSATSNYDFQNNKFKQSYISAADDLYQLNSSDSSGVPESAPWIDGILKLSSVKELLTTEPVDATSMLNNLAPATATQDSLSDTIAMMEKILEDTMLRYNYSEADVYEGNFDSRRGTSGASNSKRVFKVEKVFKKTIKTDLMDKMGYKFFGDALAETNVLSRGQMYDRGTKEYNKFFSAIPNNSDVNNLNITDEQKQELRDVRQNLFSYLTPVEIVAGSERKVIDGSDSSFDVEFSSRLELQKTERSRTLGSKGKFDLFRRGSIRNGLQFDKPKKSGKKSTKDEEFVKSSDYLGTNSKFNSPSVNKIIKGLLGSDRTQNENIKLLSSVGQDKKRSSGKIPSLQNFRSFPKKSGALRKTPIQIKALILSNSNSTKSNFGEYDVLADPSTRQSVINNFTKIRQIEYLTGYGNTAGLNIVNEMNWKLLDKEVLDNLGNQKLICRLRTYTDEYYDVTDDPEDIKDYNEIFIIDGAL